MKEKFDATEVDFMGIFKLNNAYGIENLVHRLEGSDIFLSRNYGYYNQELTVSGCSLERDFLSKMLPIEGKAGFIVVENMANLSAKVLYSELSKYVQDKPNHYLEAKACIDEDVKNLVRIMNGERAIRVSHTLPKGQESVVRRHIELDNKKIIKMVVSSLPKPQHVITPGLGSILIGPFIKAIHGTEYDLADFSAYDRRDQNKKLKISDIMHSKAAKNLPDQVLIFDDNVASGATMRKLAKVMALSGRSIKTGAAEFDWRLYGDIIDSRGENGKNNSCFSVMDFDYISYLAYHCIPRIARKSIRTLTMSDDSYFKNAIDLGFSNPHESDDAFLMRIGIGIARSHGIDLTVKNKGIKNSAVDFNNRLTQEILLNSK